MFFMKKPSRDGYTDGGKFPAGCRDSYTDGGKFHAEFFCGLRLFCLGHLLFCGGCGVILF